MANFCADMPPEKLKHLGSLKMIITSDLISSQHKHKDAFTWRPIISMMFSCNKAPEIDITEDNTGTFRRFLMWEFPYVFSPDDLKHKEDKQLREKLFTEEEAEGYLLHILDGLDRLLKNKDYTDRASVPEVRKAYIKKSNSCQAFCNECITITDDPEDWVFTDDIYRSYITYCHTEKIPTHPKGKLSQSVEQFCNGAEKFKVRPEGQKTGSPLSAWRYVKVAYVPKPKQTKLTDSVPSVPVVPPLLTNSEKNSEVVSKNSDKVESSGTVGTVGTKYVWYVKEIPQGAKCECGKLNVTLELLTPTKDTLKRCTLCYEDLRKQYTKAVWKLAYPDLSDGEDF